MLVTSADGAPQGTHGLSLSQAGADWARCRSAVRPQCTRRSYGSEMSPTWYVTVEVRPGVLPRPRSPRLTSTFETEAEAKNFARTKLREGRMAFAGTINPFTPRRTVPSHDIATWVADEQEHSADVEYRSSISHNQT